MTHKICRHYLDLFGEPSIEIVGGEWEKYYTVVSKIRTLTYRKLANLPIKVGKVSQGLEAEPFEFQNMVFCPWFFV
ncbi:MAG: hypothetical protein WAV28_11250 [Sedimentisphaerales bacterium]